MKGRINMSIPDYQSILLPLLKLAQDRKEHSLRASADVIADEFQLTLEERTQLLPSGNQTVFFNRVGWARTYLCKAGLLESNRRGFFQITPRGKDLLTEKPQKITSKSLERYPEFIEFITTKKEKTTSLLPELNGHLDPEEALETAYSTIRKNLANDIIEQIKKVSPSLFEKLVVELLLKMGYGGSRKDAGEAIGRSGDEGIDGIIKEDRLGLDIIYIQAKRWAGAVGRPEVQKFAGALQGQRAKKGVMITTSSFTPDAWDYVKKIENKIVLIDADELANLMIDHNLGVSTMASYEVKKIDSDYFIE